MAWCLTAQSHNLNQCWLVTNGVLSHLYISGVIELMYACSSFVHAVRAVFNKYYQKCEVGRYLADTPVAASLRKNCNDRREEAMTTPSYQSGRLPKVVALFSATNFSSYVIEFLKLHDTIQKKWKNAWIHYNIGITSHSML